MKSAEHLIFSSLRISSIGQLTSTILNFVITLLLLRLIAPEWFGMVAMVTAVSGFIAMIAPMGVHISLVQAQSIREEDKSTLFYWSALTGASGALIILVLQSVLEWFYQTTFPAILCPLIALELWLNTLVMIPSALLQRRMSFGQLWKGKVLSQLIGGSIAIGLALSGFPLLAVLVRPLAIALVLLLSLCIFLRWYPKRIFSKRQLGLHLSFGSAITVDSLLGYGVRNIDDIVVGRWMGTQALGIYTKAYSILLFPLRKLSSVVGNVYFPVFSKLQNRTGLLGKIYLQLCEVVSSFTFPLMSWIVVEAESIVLLVMGEAWLLSVPIIRVLSLLGALQSIGTFSGLLYQSTGRVRIQMQIGMVVKPVMIVTIILAAWYFKNPLAVALAYSIASFLSMFPEQYYAVSFLEISLGQVVAKLIPAVVVTIISAVALYLIPFEIFILRSMLFFSFYLVLYRLLFPDVYRTIITAMRKITK
jgi:PST family polysaccharide transporter